jgi:hypothetical protein
MGLFLIHPSGVEGIPLGQFFERVHPGLFLPLGYTPSPAVDAKTLFDSFGAPPGQELFVLETGKSVSIDNARFVALMALLVESADFQPIQATELNADLATPTPSLWFEPLGTFPLSGAEPLK